ncbi:DNA-directed RNA polymerase I subunit RPA49 [Caerostris darwini]|uniref:DNA-directed RNA polymerase I subunit RPA49 n=1 Tax=Caerostris darwini TaxID=1538125 RepID=A0AAV4V9X1_9ARAC|nr:DNA-directed RNA polymerase I subunit RPA49 [Caerostris darwini]
MSQVVELKLSSKRKKRAPVLITNYSHGYLNPNPSGKFKIECFKKISDASEIGVDASRNLVASTGRLNYIGSSSATNLQCFVGVRDKQTGNMKLYDCALFNMKPEMKAPKIESKPITNVTYWEGVSTLTENFGSKARQRALSIKQKSYVDVSEEMPNLINESILSPEKLNGNSLPQSMNYLPPLNRDATSIFNVFDINDIISPEESESLESEVQKLFSTTSDEFTKKRLSFCKFVSERFGNVSSEKAKFLIYYNYLVSFQKLRYNDIRKKDPAPDIPEIYKNNFMDKFTMISRTDKGREGRSMPNQLKDKLVSYIFVLALLIENFKVNLEEIVNDLNNVGIPKVALIAQSVGCYVSKKKIGEQDAKFAELKLPLYVVVPKYSKKK